MTAAGALCGLALSTGVLVLIGRLAALRRQPLAKRIGPFVGLPRAELAPRPGALIALLAPFAGTGAGRALPTLLMRAGLAILGVGGSAQVIALLKAWGM